MIRKLYFLSLLAIFAGPVTANDDTSVTFDFTNAEEINALGIETPENGAGTNITTDIVKDGVTISIDNGSASNPTRIWATNSGVLDFRIYKNASLTITVPEGKLIKEMTWTTANSVNFSASEGLASGTAWTGEANPVVLSCTSNTRINVLTISYGDHEEAYIGLSSTFDLTSAEQYGFWNISIPENGKGTSVNGNTLGDEIATMAFDNGEATTDCRVFASNSGSLNLRVYKGSKVTFRVAEGYILDGIDIESGNASNMTSADNTWSTGSFAATCVWSPDEGSDVRSVVLEAGTTLQFNKVTFRYHESEDTAIQNTLFTRTNGNSAVYNLQGQRVNPSSAKGIVIKNGKKYYQ